MSEEPDKAELLNDLGRPYSREWVLQVLEQESCKPEQAAYYEAFRDAINTLKREWWMEGKIE